MKTHAWQVLMGSSNTELNEGNIIKMYENTGFVQLTILWKELLDHLRKSTGDLSKLWMSYLDLVVDKFIDLGLHWESLEEDWELHVHVITALILYDRKISIRQEKLCQVIAWLLCSNVWTCPNSS